MKGTFFQKPLELNLVVEGETWRQGDPITGYLVLRNHGTAEMDLSAIHVSLAYGDLSKVRDKTPDAFKIATTLPLVPPRRLAPQSSDRFDWKFQTDRNCPVSDKSASLFLLYGEGPATEKLGQLALSVIPATMIEEFVKILQIDFHFAVRFQKASKAGVEVKLMPPGGSKGFATLEYLTLSLKFGEEETLEARYVFNLKKIDAQAGMQVKKQKKESAQSYPKSHYLISSGRFNHDKMEQAIKEVFDQLGSGALLEG